MIRTVGWALTELAPGQKRPWRGGGAALVCLEEHLAGQKKRR
jgi:hypothetical protein